MLEFLTSIESDCSFTEEDDAPTEVVGAKSEPTLTLVTPDNGELDMYIFCGQFDKMDDSTLLGNVKFLKRARL